jgi:hypothetical protein
MREHVMDRWQDVDRVAHVFRLRASVVRSLAAVYRLSSARGRRARQGQRSEPSHNVVPKIKAHLRMPSFHGVGPFLICALMALGLLAPPRLALSQTFDPCVAAASSWLPSTITSAKVVAKWQKGPEFKFGIFSKETSSPTARLVKAELDFVSHTTGLRLVEQDQFSSDPLPDLLVAVDPSLTTDEKMLRELAQVFFEKKLLRRFQIDAEFWRANIQKSSPKCLAANVEVNTERNFAFLMIQENETPACVRIALGEAFGVIEARNVYAANGQTISDSIFGDALRGLYSEKIRSGMSRSEALQQVQEDCKK